MDVYKAFIFVCVKVTKTTERINMEKLKAREHIMFFEEILLFEDELHDHGVSMISVKIVSVFFLAGGWGVGQA